MKHLDLPISLRRLLAWGYLLLALGAPLIVIILPGEPALSLNKKMLTLESGQSLNPGNALGEGADNYDQNILDDLVGNIASAAADYPDGSNAVLVLFDGVDSASRALDKLKGMIPHQREKRDLWATHFAADSGEYVMLARVERVLVMVISEREAMARERLAALPVLNYNPRPGLGAVLQQQSNMTCFFILVFYVVLQWLFVRRLFRGAGLTLSPQLNKEEKEVS